MAIVTPMKTPAETSLEGAFARLRDTLPGAAAERRAAFARYAERGLPHRRVEEWKYTDLRAALRDAAPLAERPAAVPAGAPDLGAPRFLIANGHVLSAPASLPAGVTAVSLREALTAGHPALSALGDPLAAGNAAVELNTAFMTDGIILTVESGVTVTEPLHLAFVNEGSQPFATAARVLVMVGGGASVTLLETHQGPAGVAYQPNTMVEIVAGDGARVDHARLNGEGDAAIVLSSLSLRLGRETELTSVNGVFGAALSRHQVFATFAGESAKASINGLALLSRTQHADSTLVVDHAEPGGESRELFRTVVDDEAAGVFQGKIIVRQKAQKTDGRMMSGALLLGEASAMYNKPELEIFADDVACAHGATCGALDEDLLFYLMARGLPKPEAEALLLQAFVGEVVETVSNEAMREVLTGRIESWLKARAAR